MNRSDDQRNAQRFGKRGSSNWAAVYFAVRAMADRAVDRDRASGDVDGHRDAYAKMRL